MRAGQCSGRRGIFGRYRVVRHARLGGAVLAALLLFASFAPAAAASSPWPAPIADFAATAKVAGLDAHLHQGDIIFASLILVATLVTAWNVRRYLRMGAGAGANRRAGE